MSLSEKMQAYTLQAIALLDRGGRFSRPLVAFSAGLLVALSFAPTDVFLLPYVAFPIAFILLVNAGSGMQAFSMGWWFGLGQFAYGLNWIGHSFSQQEFVSPALAPFAVFFLAAAMSIYSALAFWITSRLSTKGWHRVLVFSSAWLLMEIARSYLFTGFPWNLLGSLWAEWLPVAQSAYWIGVYGLSFLTVLTATALGLFFTEARVSKAGVSAVVVCLLVFPLLALAGHFRLEEHDTRFHLGVTMRLVQANVKQKEKWKRYLIDDHFESHMKLSRSHSLRGKADGIKLLIWPETAVQNETFDRDGSLERWRISRLLNYGSYAITGVPRYDRQNGRYVYFNSLMALNSKGEIYARYDKTHLVPFGEYMPFESVLEKVGLSQLTGGSPFMAGDSLMTIALPGVPSFSPLICYEAIFSGQVIREDDRPEWMLNISNDAWFGKTSGPYQHLAQSRLRAIEEGLPLIRATSTGVSAVIDSYGRTISSLGLGYKGIVESPLPVAIEASPIPSRIRILFFAFLSAGILLFYLVRDWRRLRS